MALIGLRMMPTFPSSPLRFRTAGFPRYGSKAGCQSVPAQGKATTPHRGLPPTFVSSWAPVTLARSRGGAPINDTAVRAASPLYPRGPRSGLGYVVPVHHHLIGPMRPTRRHVATSPPWRVICDAFAVLATRLPKPSTSGSELSHTIPSQPVALVCPRRVHRLHTPRLHRWDSPSSHPTKDSALSSLPLQSAPRGAPFRGFLVRSLAATGWVACLSGGPDQRCRQPPEAFTSELSVESVTLLAVGYNYSGIWVPPLAGLPPAGMVASFAALGRWRGPDFE